MKIKLMLMSLLLFCSVSFAKDEVLFTDPLKTIVVTEKSPVFSVILRTNPSVGFLWILKNYDANLISPISRKVYPAVNKKAGYEKWFFRVKPTSFAVPQLTSIALINSRLQDEQGAQLNNFKVVINNAN